MLSTTSLQTIDDDLVVRGDGVEQLVGRLGGWPPIIRTGCGCFFTLENRIERMSDGAPRRDTAYNAKSAAIADLRSVLFPDRTKCAEQLDSISADPEVRSLYNL